MAMGTLIYHTARESVPDEIRVVKNQDVDWELMFDRKVITYDPAVEASWRGSYRVECRLFGVIPLKTVKVIPVDTQMVYASGSPVGIYMETEGVLIIDSGEIRNAEGILQAPAEHIVQPGDYIRKVDGEVLESKKQLIKMVSENQGTPMEMEVMRNNERIKISLTPIQTEDGSYKLGLWVRDNIQGIGTLTYIDESGRFGALGHGISDVDTGEQLNIEQGELYDARILSVQKGTSGSPGELRGIIDYQDYLKLGEICKNTANGITGRLHTGKGAALHREAYEITLKQDLQTGPAHILSDVGDGVKEYDIEIVKIDRNAKDSNKSFVIQVTDPELLSKTGGIVQGMSGSPIIQNGKLAGAVTHVLVNDPARGYGIFIENMFVGFSYYPEWEACRSSHSCVGK